MRRLLPVVLTLVLLGAAVPALAAPAPLTTNPRSAAGALARATALTTSFRLPAGVVWTTKVTRRPDLVTATQTVAVSRHAAGSHANASLLEFLRTHPVAGMVVAAEDQFIPGQSQFDYSTKVATDSSAQLTYTVHGAEVQLDLQVTVGWTPARPADTLLPSGLRGVTVEVWPAEDLGGPTPAPAFGHQVIHATGPAVRTLAHYLDGLPVAGPFGYGAGACTRPLFYGSNPRLTFRTPQHVVVFQYVGRCQNFNVSVDGKHRPSLVADARDVDATRLVMTRLLHLVP